MGSVTPLPMDSGCKIPEGTGRSFVGVLARDFLAVEPGLFLPWAQVEIERPRIPRLSVQVPVRVGN